MNEDEEISDSAADNSEARQGPNAEARPALAPRVRIQKDRVTGGSALLYPEGVLLLNPTGEAIVALCDGVRTVAQITAQLAAQYLVTADELTGDVESYLNRLIERRLLMIVT